MGTTTIKNVRATSDLTVRVRLKDGGVAVEWPELSNIKAWLYSDAQKAISGRFEVSVDQEDPTTLICVYSAQKPQYLGINRVIVQASYLGELKTYDKKAFSFVRWTEEQGTITIDDPDVDVEIEVQDVTSSILQEAIAAAVTAAVRAEEAAAAAEHMVDIHQGPPGPAGKAPYIDETTGNWFVWDDQTEQYVDSGKHAQGATGNGIASWSVVESQEDGGSNVVTVVFTNGDSESFTVKNGHTGATPNLTIGTVETGAAGSQAEATITGTAASPVLNLRIPQGVPGVVQAKYVEVDTLPTASASTMNALYLVPSQVQLGTYDIYYTSEDGRETYSWVFLCGTAIQLSDYATKAEVTQLEHKLNNLADTRYYGIYASADLLPDDATEKGYAYVGASTPLAIYEVDYDSETEQWVWTDTGVTVNSIQGEPGTDGVGFGSIATPVVADGTATITLSDGDTITLDLNHNHPAYYSKVAETSNPSGGFLPDVAYNLGTLTGTVTFVLAAAVTGQLNHYFWMFDTGGTAPTVTFPNGITWADGTGPTVAANKHYEISILGGIAYYSEV